MQPDSEITRMLTRLRLPHMRKQFQDIIHTAKAQRWTHLEFFTALLRLEVQGRDSNNLERRIIKLGVPPSRTLQTYQPALSSIPPHTISFLAGLEWVENKENLVVAGPSGTGKTHLCQALAYEVVMQGGSAVCLTLGGIEQAITSHTIDHTIETYIQKIVKNTLVVIDDIGILPISEPAALGLFKIIEACYETTSIAFSTNIMPTKLDTLMQTTMATAMVDRLLHHAHVCQTSGDSIRMIQAKQKQGVHTMT